MPGKSYTMREMKQIVDYLTEHKLYDEVRGRKMWMTFANSGQLDRTWQSLKETFLKRILPDIHNPYYRLTVEQICSFRQESDISAQNKNKLEIRTISDDSSSNADNQKVSEQPSTSKNVEEPTSGEDVKCSKIHSRTRSSTETLVLEKCYETAEDVQRALESENEAQAPGTVSIRDLIIYTEPLTPMLQEVYDDFATDDDEPQMQIVETEVNKEPSPDEIRQSQSLIKGLDNSINQVEKETIEINGDKTQQASKLKTLKLKKTRQGTWKNKESGNVSDNDSISNQNKDQLGNPDNTLPTIIHSENNDKTRNVSVSNRNVMDVEKNLNEKSKKKQNCVESNRTLPTNEEPCLDKSIEPVVSKNTTTGFQSIEIIKSQHGRKRSHSQVDTDLKQKLPKDKHVMTDSEVQKRKNVYEEAVMTILDKNTNNEHSEDIVPLSSENRIPDSDIPCGQQKLDTSSQLNCIVENTEGKQSEDNTPQINDHPVVVSDTNNTPSEINPCLKSVSLFAEQFSTTKYIDSESDNETHAINKSDQKEPESTAKATGENNHNITQIKDTKLNKPKQSEVQAKRTINEVETSKKLEHSKVPINKEIKSTNSIDEGAQAHSESNKDLCSIAKTSKKSNDVPKLQRDRNLANLFGFSSGGTYRKRTSSYRDRSSRHYTNRRSSRHSHNNVTTSGSSSDYTTMSESDDYSSPPRNKRQRRDRKYMKPEPLNILSGPDGALFVTDGKKIYPFVRKGKRVMNYCRFSEWEQEDEADDYWKSKYLEAKQEIIELKRKLDEDKIKEVPRPSVSPILQIVNKSPVKQVQSAPSNACDKTETKLFGEAQTGQNPVVKFKFTKENDVELDCPAMYLNTVLEKMDEIFRRPRKSKSDETLPKARSVSTEVISSGKSTPILAMIDPETHEKVNKIESEIFSEIAVRDSSEKVDNNKTNKEVNGVSKTNSTGETKIATEANLAPETNLLLDANVTKRRGRPRNSSPKSPKVSKSVMITKNSDETDQENAQAGKRSKLRKVSSSPLVSEQNAENIGKDVNEKDPIETRNKSKTEVVATKRPTRIPKKFGDDKGTNKNKSSPAKSTRSNIEISIPDNDSQVRYKFPKSAPTSRNSSKTRTTAKVVDQKSKNTYTRKKPSFLLPVNTNSVESTQGYQDSDISSETIALYRKRKLNTPNHLCRGRYTCRSKIRRKSHPYLADDETCDASMNLAVKSAYGQNSSSNTDIYRSESYQLLMPKTKNQSTKQLKKIDELSLKIVDTINENNSNSISPIKVRINCQEINKTNSPKTERTSSIISLPLSPELSVVENISIRKDILTSAVGHHPTINETESNNVTISETDSSKYLIDEVDVSVPLMEQECELLNSRKKKIAKDITLKTPKPTVSESLLNKISSVNIEETSLTDLDIRLRNLLLESAKKLVQEMQEKIEIEVEDMEVDKEQKTTQAKKKRCSTPRKRIATQKPKPSDQPIIQEHVESCSYFGKNRLPSINIINPQNIIESENVLKNIDAEVATNRRQKKKKDIIKVKIIKPKEKSIKVETRLMKKAYTSGSRMSVCTDSGINDNESVSQECDDSVDLIHNHSETCLNVSECFEESVEFVEKSNSVISLDSSLMRMKNQMSSNPELFCNNAQDGVHETNTVNKINSAIGIYHSPFSNLSLNSLLTEDLSDEVPPSPPKCRPNKWYLLSEEETTNTKLLDACSAVSNAGSFANLKQIFPITCSVPNLSTITEASRENDSRKPTMENDGC